MAKAKISAHQYWTINPFIWIVLLVQNGGVHWTKVPKAIIITIISILTYPLQLAQWILYRLNKHKTIDIEDPIFIIGHWRSGTTFLQYLMCKNPKYGFLSYYQGFMPTISIVGGNVIKSLLTRFIPKKRPQDNIELSSDLPHEEENAIADFSSHSASHSFFFPKNERYYRKFALLEGMTKMQYRRWKGAYRRMLDEISIANNYKPLVIKNPHNTGRIKGLLDIYPNAKFIHIYRNPLDVIPSTFLMYDTVVQTQYLEKYSSEQTLDKVFYYYDSIMNNLFDQIDLIPKENLFEIKFEDFQFDAVEIMQELYQKLDLEYTDEVEHRIKEYVASKKNYIKNIHKVDEQLKSRILDECGFAFEKLGYDLAEAI